MNKRNEFSHSGHPTSVELDRLRAGLFDNEPTRRTTLQTHLDNCSDCQTQATLWPRVTATLEAATREHGLVARLLARRQRALRGQPAETRRRAPMVLAFATLAAMAIGLGTLVLPHKNSVDHNVAAAETEPDLYADIDFYLWLSHKESNEDDSLPNG
ncbi:MAG: hypothetical protein HY308_09515 [Gammaproteobacteria bacterium]|nr:hypothetical protein [Gammaproteobacteria bacterium]